MFEIVGWDNKEELVIVIYKRCILDVKIQIGKRKKRKTMDHASSNDFKFFIIIRKNCL